MRRNPAIVVVLVLLLLAACGRKEEESRTAATPELGYEVASVERTDDPCPDPKGCTRVSFVYPRFTGGGAVAADSLNAYVSSRILATPMGGVAATTPDSIADGFIAEFRRFKAEFPESAGRWFLDRTVDVLSAPPGVVSLRSMEAVFSGGAHGLETVLLASFDRATGRRLGRADLFRAGSEAALDSVAEAAFRRARDLAPDEDLAKAGFTFDGGRFRAGDNFAAVTGGVLFRFNPYEVAPYAWGPTDFFVPTADLAGVALAGGPLAPAAGR